MKKLFTKIATTLLVVALGFGANAQRVGAYYANWTGYRATASQYAKLTDVYWSFLIPATDGSIGWGSTWDAQNRFNQFLADCPSTVRKKISVGGDGITSFSNIMANSTARANFATNLANFVKNNNIDGVDIDWEYPKSAEAANFALFLADLNSKLDAVGTQLGKPIELSIAVFSTNAYGTEGISAAVINAVDYINIMSYDNNQETNHSTYAWATGSTVFGFWKTKVPVSKLVLGLPFYGRPANSPTNSNGQDIKTFKSVSAANVNNDTEGGYYYNGKATIKSKTQFALSNGMLGVMFWELSQDRTDADALLTVVDGEIKSYGCTKPEFTALTVPICGQSSVTLNPSNASILSTGYTYSWKSNGSQVSTSLSYAPTAAGTYELSVTKTGSNPTCTKTATVIVTNVFAKPNLGSDIPVCSGQTVDLDAGIAYTGVNYNWTKNGSPLTPKTQKITGQSAGTYIVSLSDPLNKCTNTSIAKDTIVVQTGSIKVKNDTTCVSGGTVNLEVLTQGGPYSWYDAQTNGTFVNSGAKFTTPLTATKTYWVGNSGGSVSAKFGWAYNATTIAAGLYKVPGADFASDTRLKLNVKQKTTIDTATIHINGAKYGVDATVTFTVYKADQTVYKTITTVVSGLKNGGVGKQRVPVGIEIDPGLSAATFYIGYTSVQAGSTTVINPITEKNVWGTNFTYPFSTDFIDIMATVAKSESNFGLDLKNWYCGLYDIKVSTGASCPRVAVSGVLSTTCPNPTLTVTTTPSSATIKQGETVSFSSVVKSGMASAYITQVTYVIKNSSNTVVESKTGSGVDFGTAWSTTTQTAAGTYKVEVTATDSRGATITKTINVNVTSVVGLDDFASNDIYLSPMPFKNTFTVNVPASMMNSYSLTVYNMTGTAVYSNNFENNGKVEVSQDLEPGMYIIKLENNGLTLQGRIIKE